ncbi:MAG: SMP-30/gluconolactonase/LRE family protein [Verrucomicrobiales bacterium]
MKVSTSTLWASLLCLAAASLNAAEFDIRNEKAWKQIASSEAKVEKLSGGFKFVEGPAWVPQDGGYLVFSDIPANEIKKWSEKGGVTTFRAPSFNANGNLYIGKGEILSAEHEGRRVSVAKAGEDPKTVVSEHEGKKFNSPNDLAVKSDGTIWFTDPDYGLGGRTKEAGGNYVYAYNPKTKKTSVVVKDFDKPNGICFSPDEKKLYVADSGRPHHIRVFNVQPDNTLDSGNIFAVIDKGGPDGIRCDAEGRVWSSAGDGVHVFGTDGALLGKILCPESPANLCFGGDDFKTLYITARTGLYRVKVEAKGAGQVK